MTASQISQDLHEIADPEIAQKSLRFFKTGKGEYGEGDQFLGIKVPVLREVVKKYKATSRSEVLKLLQSPWHEARLCALFILVLQFKKGKDIDRTAIYEAYLNHTKWINNWDLVDSSAYFIVGPYLENKDRSVLYELARSKSIWERRIAMLATMHYIRKGEFADTLALAEILLHDKEDLMHKAVGWLLREIGKRDKEVEETFLKKHYRQMPRTMLRYAIEKFSVEERERYLAGTV